jgi:hypothetical protein
MNPEKLGHAVVSRPGDEQKDTCHYHQVPQDHQIALPAKEGRLVDGVGIVNQWNKGYQGHSIVKEAIEPEPFTQFVSHIVRYLCGYQGAVKRTPQNP